MAALKETRPGRARARAGLGLALAVAAGCGADDAPGGYLDDARVRRAALEASLVEPTNAYSRRRLEHYATGHEGDWDALPIWNPRVAPIAASELGPPGGAATLGPADGASTLGPPGGAAALGQVGETSTLGPADGAATLGRAGEAFGRAALGPEASALDLSGAVTPEGLRALGEEAFFRYPAQPLPSAALALGSPEAAAAYGLWVDERYGVGGLVRVELPSGKTTIALSCASCHAAPRPGLGLVTGVGNERFDLGRLAFDAGGGGAERAALLAWGPGRVDVSTADGAEPVRIPDLRPTRWLSHLHHAGAVAQRDVVALAVRVETLIITSNAAALRPPREVALGLASFLWSLAPASAPAPAAGGVASRGEALFGERCARCHAPPGFAGPPVAADEVGTDPAIARSSDRGTGHYRVPSLRGVASRGPLLHDASAPTLEVLFDPARLDATFAGGARGGPVVGHPFGLELDGDDRAALLAYVRTL